jgi:hypothetical protein
VLAEARHIDIVSVGGVNNHRAFTRFHRHAVDFNVDFVAHEFLLDRSM